MNIEKLIEIITYKGMEFEIVERTDVLWVGSVDYSNNNTDESNIDATLKRFQELVGETEIKEKINPDWSAALSINYTRSDKPCGIMFANESYSSEQDERFEQLTQPDGLWLRIAANEDKDAILFGRKSHGLFEYFGELRNAAKENGYIQNPEVNIEIEYHCHAEYGEPHPKSYAYISIARKI
jgi:hypothetical protein